MVQVPWHGQILHGRLLAHNSELRPVLMEPAADFTLHIYMSVAAGYFSSVSAARARPSRPAAKVSGPGKLTRTPGPGSRPDGATWVQSCAAWRTKGSGLAQPLIFAVMMRVRSVAEAPMPPQSSQALR